MPAPPSDSVSFEDVLKAELGKIDQRRQMRFQDAARSAPPTDAASAKEDAREREMIGLAFSGGGIRSATFNLGLLQGLAGLGLLKYFDYLSTVSGGGYIGSWLTAWMQREPAGAAAVEGKLHPKQPPLPDGAGPDPIKHLRRHSNYLAPRLGLFSADRWVLWAIYLRNFLLNQLMLLPMAFVLVLLSRVVMLLYFWPFLDHWPWRPDAAPLPETFSAHLPMPLPSFFVVLGLFTVSALLGLTQSLRAAGLVRGKGVGKHALPKDPKSADWMLGWVLVPLSLSALVFCYLSPYSFPLSDWLNREAPSANLPWWVPQWWAADLLAFAFFAMLIIDLAYLLSGVTGNIGMGGGWFWRHVTAIAWGALLFGAYRLLHWLYDVNTEESLWYMQISGVALATMLGPPLVVLATVLGISVGLGLLRQELTEELREWWASLCARLLMFAAAWALTNLVALFGTPLVLWAGPWVQAVLGSGWILTVMSGVIAGGSRRTDGAQNRTPLLDRIARVALHAFVAGIFVLISLLVHVALDSAPEANLSDGSIWPYRYEPQHPPTRVSFTRDGNSGEVAVESKREQVRIPDDAAATRQQYWLGMLSPRVPERFRHWTYWINAAEMEYLKKKGVSVKSLETLRPFRRWQADDFREQLRKYLKENKLAIAERDQRGILIIAQIRGFQSGGRYFEFHREILHKDRIDAIHKDLWEHLEGFQYQQWEFEELQHKIDQLFPQADQKEIRNAVLRKVRGEGLSVELKLSLTWTKIGLSALVCAVLLLVGAFRIDVNAFSLHNLYQNRLVRAYLGASRAGATREPDPYSGFDPDDDLFLSQLGNPNFGRPATPLPQTYDGPYPLINTAINTVRTKELAWQERMAASFLLSPLHCGSEITKYRPTISVDRSYGGSTGSEGLTVGTAVTLSGAAASPNMGYHSSPAISFLLTVFNARLGAWLGNPKADRHWHDPGPRYGFWHLFKELTGWTDETSDYIYLSDGGHFENLGVYELVKRRCRYIVVGDAGQDEFHRFEDLGNLIRKVRIDLGIRIELSPDCLKLGAEPRHSRWHCALGKIRYDDVDAEAAPGTLVYIKPSLTGDEPADVLHYAAAHANFPHESTANQFYTESQFESYRALGQHIAESIFKLSVFDADEEGPKDQTRASWRNKHGPYCRAFFASLERRWFAMPPEYEAAFIESTHGFMDVQEAFRDNPALCGLTHDLYPELAAPGRSSCGCGQSHTDADAAELHALAHMLQVMENAYLSLNLEVNHAHPLNRGWMEVYHRWTSAPTFRRHWLHLRGEFSRAFVRFCERQMRLGQVIGRPQRLARGQSRKHLDRLLYELCHQWPKECVTVEQKLAELDTTKPQVHAWTIHAAIRSETDADDHVEPAPAGIVVIWSEGRDLTTTPPTDKYELFVWMRGAYRNTGLGRPAVFSILEQLADPKELSPQFPRPFRLHVRLPVGELPGPGGKLQKSMWLTFFYQLGFVRMNAGPEHEDDPILELRRDFRDEAPSTGAGPA